uniref:Uncharacterized protein n=1 Tax=Ceratitis capitata TaxID=7213 RepID=W8C0W3_CERCA
MKISFLLWSLLATYIHATIARSPELFTCDFDLVNGQGNSPYQPWTRSFLSSNCLNMYDKQHTDRHMYDMYMNEALEFRKFIAAIENYEAKKSGKPLCHDKEYALNLEDRQKFYQLANLFDCYKMNNYETFLNCITEKRKELVNIINNAGA